MTRTICTGGLGGHRCLPAAYVRKTILVLLVLFLFCSAVVIPVSAATGPRPRIYEGYDVTPLLNVSTGLDAGDVLDVSGTFNASSWMTTTIGKITETLWLPSDLFFAFLAIWFVALLFSRQNNDLIVATIALIAIVFIYVNLPFINYHGIESHVITEGAKVQGQTLLQPEQSIVIVQPWQELVLMRNGYVYIIWGFAGVTLFNWAICLWLTIYSMINKPSLTPPDRDRG